ncbi:unnamed protein product [Larinioides sclopetarius]|uniref:Uncharacterized protein n=1 Tax=Larinioides sclopetarius TaxID=280406 RepID=A0AAV2C2B3_9ARAC
MKNRMNVEHVVNDFQKRSI